MIDQKQIDKIITLCDEALTNIETFSKMVEHLEKRIVALEKKIEFGPIAVKPPPYTAKVTLNPGAPAAPGPVGVGCIPPTKPKKTWWIEPDNIKEISPNYGVSNSLTEIAARHRHKFIEVMAVPKHD